MSNEYSMEELLPIVAGLAEKYTSGESGSITYERARQLMGAVMYCIEEVRNDDGKNSPSAQNKLNAEEVYLCGYQKVLEKTKKTVKMYNELILNFKDYGNENYRDTVRKAIPAFFRYYDARFAPQETIITMDYPTIRPIMGITGIDAVYEYVKCISLEQKFLHEIPVKYAENILLRYHKGYKRQFFNLCGIILRYVVGQMIVKEKQSEEFLKDFPEKFDKKETELILKKMLHRLIEGKYGGDSLLEKYLEYEMKDFAFELKSDICHIDWQ